MFLLVSLLFVYSNDTIVVFKNTYRQGNSLSLLVEHTPGGTIDVSAEILPAVRATTKIDGDGVTTFDYSERDLAITGDFVFFDPELADEKVLLLVHPGEWVGPVAMIPTQMLLVILMDDGIVVDIDESAEDYAAFHELMIFKTVDRFHCDNEPAHDTNIVHHGANNNNQCHGVTGNTGKCQENSSGMVWGVTCGVQSTFGQTIEYCYAGADCPSGQTMTVTQNGVTVSEGVSYFQKSTTRIGGEAYARYEGDGTVTISVTGKGNFTLNCGGANTKN